jgi:hypothetical protein
MKSNDLPLPAGYENNPSRCAYYWGGMRVICEYSISSDSFVARFDRLDDGVQRNISFDSSDLADLWDRSAVGARDFSWMCTIQAVAAFASGNVAQGKERRVQKVNLN